MKLLTKDDFEDCKGEEVYFHGHAVQFGFSSEKELIEFRDQILKNQDKAKEFDNFLVEWNKVYPNQEPIWDKFLQSDKRNFLIVELLKKRIEVAVQAGKEGSQAEEYVEKILQKILEGEK